MFRIAVLAGLVCSTTALNTTEFIKRAGYPAESYAAETKDGYLLGIERIPHGRNESSLGMQQQRPVVFLLHGLLDCSATWVCNPAEESLAFILADKGYDVWLGNVRGNEYSLGHTGTISKNDDAFWDFSFDEFASIDLPTMLEFVLGKTGAPTLRFVGHSQGTLTMLIALSDNDFVRRSVSHAALLGPVMKVGHADLGVLRLVADLPIYDVFGKRSFALTVPMLEKLFPDICKPLKYACEALILELVGFDPKETNASRVADYVSFDPAGTSTKNMVHWIQLLKSGLWRRYDYGTAQKNIEHYGTATPPPYNITKVSGPELMLISGGRDKLADPKDVAILEADLAHLNPFIVDVPYYDHLDYVWAENAHTLIYPKLLQFLEDIK